MTQYQYRPLETARHIRLLELRSRRPDDAIDQASEDDLVVGLHHVCLDDPQRPWFEPLSYCGTGSEVIDIRDRERWERASKRDHTLKIGESDFLPLTKSLKAALPYIDKVSESRFLWIDQLCIDEGNLEERSQQVSIMHKIYAGGCMTLVWLGQATEYTRDLCQILDAAGRQFLDFARTRKSGKTIRRTIISLNKDIASHAVPLDLHAIMGDLWTRAWFTRSWILQEVAHSTKVKIVIGSFVFTQNDLHTTAVATDQLRVGNRNGMTRKPEDTSKDISNYFAHALFSQIFETKRWVASKPPALHKRLEDRICGRLIGTTLVSDPKDIINAFLNISAKEPIFFATPDYTLSVAETFAKATRYFIHDTGRGRLNILHHFGGILSGTPETYWSSNSGKENLPSWSFDWGSWRSFGRLSGERMTSISSWSPYCADNNRQIGLALYDYDALGTLDVKGKIISTVANNRQSFPEVDTCLKLSKDCLELDAIASELKVYCSSLDQSEGTNPRPIPSSKFRNASLSKRGLLKMLSFGLISRDYILFGSTADHWSSLSVEQKLAFVLAKYENEFHDDIKLVLDIARNRCAFVDTQQRLGMGSEGMQVGDCIAIIHGASTPILLRKKANSHQYLFAGPCYLEGAMFGEAVTWDEEDANAIELC